MKFTDSPVIELPVADDVLRIEQDNATMHVGTSVWPCSLVVVKFIERALANPKYAPLLDFKGKRGIELGTGCGVAGMGLAILGLDVVLTDISAVMPALKRNVKKNTASTSLSKPTSGKLKIAQLIWNNQSQIDAVKPPFDYIVATDVVYLENIVEPLITTMHKLAVPNTVVFFGYQLRSPEAHKMFWDMLPQFFSFEKVAREDLHPEYAYEEVDVFILRKK